MKLKKGRSVHLIVLALAVIVASAGVRLYRATERKAATEGRLTVHFIDVGQGDAALLTFPNGATAMIDTGTAQSAEKVVAYLKRWNIDRIDRIFLSHGHSDHAGGLNALCGAFEVREIGYMDQPPTLECGQDASAPMLTALSVGEVIEIGSAKITALGPLSAMEEENDNSLILRIDYGNRSFLFMGDAEEGEEASLLAEVPELLDADVLKVGHHGSANSTTEAFVQAVTPEVAVISASADNTFGHPAESVVERLKASGASVLSTHTSGSVTLICDGETVVHRMGDDFLAVQKNFSVFNVKTKKTIDFLKFQKNTCNFL